jgi:hypothetical protein
VRRARMSISALLEPVIVGLKAPLGRVVFRVSNE